MLDCDELKLKLVAAPKNIHRFLREYTQHTTRYYHGVKAIHQLLALAD